MHLFKTINQKVTTYLIGVGIIFLILFLFLFSFKSKSEKQIVDNSKKQFKREVDYLFELSSLPMIETTYDYSYWDDFANAIEHNDSTWIRNTITLTNSFNYEYICIYDKNFNIISDLSKVHGEIEQFIPKDTLINIARRNKTHFFSNSLGGLMEVTFNSIHPTNDPDHNKTLPSGYLIVGRKLDLVYINKMAEIFGAKVSLNFSKSDTIKGDETISAYISLHNWDGRYVSSIVFNRLIPHNFQASKALSYFIFFSILVILLFFTLFTRKNVDKPLKLTMNILESENKESVKLLKQYPNEFGHIAKLFERFVEQRVELNIAKEKSQESDRLKTAFLANMSHEIRTPMNGILGFTELLKKQNLSSKDQQKYLEIIESSGARLLNIVNNIVDISKIESGVIEIIEKQSNINSQIDFLNAFFAPEIESKGLKLVVRKSLASEDAYIITDIEKLYGILTNLLKNAIKHTEKGAIEIGYELKLVSNKTMLEFFVTDSGNGIPEDRINVIFDRFMQADMSNKTAYQGAGLGLSISKAYVELLGGNIWVESTHNIGSTFRFTIPYIPDEVEKMKEQITPTTWIDKSINKLKILIVEDDAGMEFLLSETVEDFCSELLIARDGLEALEITKNNPDIDLIFMDIRIPKMDGYETTEEIRKFNKEVIIIAQTACAFSSDKEKAIEIGCNDYVSKPIDSKLFEMLIEKHFTLSLVEV